MEPCDGVLGPLVETEMSGKDVNIEKEDGFDALFLDCLIVVVPALKVG